MNVNFYELDQAYIFCFNVVMSLVSFDDPTKFYSSEMQDKYKELFNALKKAGDIPDDKEFHPLELTTDLLHGIIKELIKSIPDSIPNKTEYLEKLNGLLENKLTVHEVIEFFSKERIRIDNQIYYNG